MISKETVLITGCSDCGIGSGLALLFQQRGYHVFATARNVSKMSNLRGISDMTLLQLDVTEPNMIRSAVEAVSKATGGKLNVLVNNAGHNHFMPILDENIDAMKFLFDINVFAPVAITQAFAPLLRESKGLITFITSTAGYLNIPYMGTYSATKRGIEIIADTLRLEIAPFGVDVLEIVTGAVQSRGQTYFDKFTLPQDSLYKPIETKIASRAQGKDGRPRMDLTEYSTAVVDAIVKREAGKFWYGQNAEMVKMSTVATSVPQSAMDAGAILGTGLDVLVKGL